MRPPRGASGYRALESVQEPPECPHSGPGPELSTGPGRQRGRSSHQRRLHSPLASWRALHTGVRSPLFRVPLLPSPTALGVQGGAACVAWEVEGLPLLLSSVQGKTADASPPSRGVLSSEMRRGSLLGS